MLRRFNITTRLEREDTAAPVESEAFAVENETAESFESPESIFEAPNDLLDCHSHGQQVLVEDSSSPDSGTADFIGCLCMISRPPAVGKLPQAAVQRIATAD